jgi:hypothetical protein
LDHLSCVSSSSGVVVELMVCLFFPWLVFNWPFPFRDALALGPFWDDLSSCFSCPSSSSWVV